LHHIVDGAQSKLNSISLGFLNHVTALETLAEIETTFFELFDEIIVLKNGAKDKKKNEIVNTAIQIIHESYRDKNLSLTSCAESLN
ncbi:hypothetical protein JDS79_43370, partial [Bacillus cereus]|nr:hypothetical protein [Bacillus cereus]